MDNTLKAVIIGSGVAGLASAIRLAVKGFEVTVFEKNSYPGGKLSHLKKNSYHFDAGPSLFTQPENIEELFELAGEPIGNYFQYTPVDITCKYFYEDGIIINAYSDQEKFAQELYEKVGEEAIRLKKYLKKSAGVYNNIGSIFLNYSLHKRNTLTRAPIKKAIRSTRLPYLFSTMNELNTAAFAKAHTIQLFNRYATYNGSDPYQAPGMLTLIPHVEHNEGVFYPKGGMISITNALYHLAVNKGVKFFFDTPVQQIIKKGNRVSGVTAKGESFASDIVVSNGDVYFTYKNLLNDESKAKKILMQERSSSALIFYWGMQKEFEQLELHNIFFTTKYKEEFDHLFRLKKLFKDPTVYINITSKYEAGIHAPAGKENWFVMINAPANIGQDWKVFAQQARRAIIEKLNRLLQTDIEPLIEEEEMLDPVLLETKTSSYMGSLYGSSSNSRMAAFLRHPNFSNAVKGLYFVGGSVHPGGGIPLCFKSAKIMSEIVTNDVKMNKP